MAFGWALWASGGSAAATLTTGTIIGSAPPERAGAVAALAQTGAELGGALGIAVLGSLGTAIYRGMVASALRQAYRPRPRRRGTRYLRRCVERGQPDSNAAAAATLKLDGASIAQLTHGATRHVRNRRSDLNAMAIAERSTCAAHGPECQAPIESCEREPALAAWTNCSCKLAP